MTDGRTRITQRALGLSDLSEREYHADAIDADRPSLSASIAHLLCTSSPAHARAAHPKLNPTFARVDEDKFDIGTVTHALLLQGDEIADVCDFDDWRTKAAKEQRDAARLAGRVPLLAKDWARVQQMVAAVREQLAGFDVVVPLLAEGKPEQTLVWEEDDVLCRARIDWLRDDLGAIDDLKTTSRSANPDPWSRQTMFSIGADIQVAFYLRGIRAVTGRTPEWRFVVCETTSPFAVSVVSLPPAVMQLANRKAEWAIRRWQRCLAEDVWPAYPTKVWWAELPPWEEARWLDREALDDEVAA